jgi:hypothetical protein
MRASLLLGLAAIGLASACGGRSGLLAPEGGDGGGQQDAAWSVEVSDSAPSAPTPSVVSGAPDSAIAEDGGCSASLLTYESPSAAFGACWTCAKKECSSQLTACAADCACNDAIARALSCADKGGGTAPCFLSAFDSAGDPTQMAVSACLMMAYNQCSCAIGPNPGPTPTVDAAPPTTCTQLGGSGGFGNGQCDNTSGEMCGGINYQVSCACPRGSCVCFGPTTHVVSFPGCPYCPSDPPVGPTTIAQVFALCGFPH